MWVCVGMSIMGLIGIGIWIAIKLTKKKSNILPISNPPNMIPMNSMGPRYPSMNGLGPQNCTSMGPGGFDGSNANLFGNGFGQFDPQGNNFMGNTGQQRGFNSGDGNNSFGNPIYIYIYNLYSSILIYQVCN